MIKAYCDKCKDELTDPEYRFEAMMIEKKISFDAKQGGVPQFIKSQLHFCRKCVEESKLCQTK